MKKLGKLVMKFPKTSRRIIAIIVLIFHSFPTFAAAMGGGSFFMYFPLGTFLFILWDPFAISSKTEWLVTSHAFPYRGLPVALGYIGMFLIVAGITLFLTAYVHYFARRRKGLLTAGLYSIVRHPQYLGIILATFGITLFRRPTSAWPLPLSGTFVYWRPMEIIAWLTLVFTYLLLANNEEKHLQKKYGADFLSYKRRVPFILPLLPPDISKRLRLGIPRSGLRKIVFLSCLYLWIVIVSVACFMYLAAQYATFIR